MKQEEKLVMKVSTVSLAGNTALTALKMAAGVSGHSSAMISDAIHSASDVFSTIVVMVGYRLSSQDSDEDHPFGHDRLECIAALLLAILLGITGFLIGLQGAASILNGSYRNKLLPGNIAIAAAIVSMASKEIMFQYTRHAALEIRSDALMADAWHHRTDALSSVGSFLGIFGAMHGLPVLDSLAGIVISCFIMQAAISIFHDAEKKLVDHACDPETTKKMQETIERIPGVIRIDSLHSRLFGAKMYVEVEISADASIPLSESHQIAQAIHDAIEASFPAVKHCMVHVNPWEHL